MRRHTFVVVTWAALLAILMAVMAPTLSHILPKSKITISFNICSATDISSARQMVVDIDNPAPHATSFEHCPFCQHGPGAFVLPSVAFRLPLLIGTALRPALFYASPTPLFAWTSAQPRGPPAA